MGMYINKILVLLILALPATIAAQIRDGSYKALKTGSGDAVETITVKVVPLGNGVLHFHEGDPRNPLTGTYRIILSRSEHRTGNFKKGLADGDWENLYDDKLQEKSFYKNGLRDGKTIRYRRNGEEEYVLTCKNGLKQHYVSYYPGGRVQEEQFYDENGNLHGEMFSYDEAGNSKSEKRYRHGKLQGTQVEVDGNGSKTSREYVDGKRWGKYSKSYPNGVPAEEGAYDENGEKTGLWATRNEDGSPKAKEHFLNGKRDGEKRVYYAGGNLKSREQYAAGELHGKTTEYDEDLHHSTREVTYSKGRLHGPFKVWHNDILWREGAYQDNKLIYEKEYTGGKLRIVKLLDENGALVPVEKYDNTGKRTYKNKDYRNHASVILKESSAGVVDVEIE